MIDGFDVRTAYNPVMHGIDIYFVRRAPDGTIDVLQSGEIIDKVVTIQPNESLENGPKPYITLGHMDVQKLVDALAQQGIKPDTDAKLVGELAATKLHLADMRKLALKSE